MSENGYRERNATFRSGAVQLSGTLLLPEGDGTYPGVVMVHGSRAQSRVSNRELAEHFARNGIAALLYDKRGVGQSTGDWRGSDFLELAGDALSACAYLAEQPEIDEHHIGLWGISQGGWIVPLAASLSQRVRFVIVVAACGITPVEQNIFRSKNVQRLERMGWWHRAGQDLLWHAMFALLRGLPERWIPLHVGARQLKRTMFFDPVPVWERVTVPVLAIWGERDTLVPPVESRDIILAALGRAGNEDVTVQMFPRAEHAVQVIQPDGSAEWSLENLAPGYLDAMSHWIHRVASGESGTSTGNR